MEENVKNNDYDEEISLIDLFAVLIRFRKLIVLGTAIAAILAGLYLFVLPKIRPAQAKSGLKVTYFIDVNNYLNNSNSLLRKLGVTINISDEASAFFEDYASLSKEYKKYPFLGEPSENSLEYNQFIINTFENCLAKGGKKEASKRVAVTKKVGNVIYLECKISSEIYENKIINEFVKNYVEYINSELNELALERVAKSYLDLKEAVENDTDVSYEKNYLQKNLKETLHDIDESNSNTLRFVSLTDEPFVVTDEPFVVTDEPFVVTDEPGTKSNAKMFIIIVFAAAFLFVFIAFANNAVINIKNDPESFNKITEAWNNGK